MSNSLDPDQDRQYVGCDLGSNCLLAGPCSIVGNMSDCRYVSYGRSRCREYDPSPVPYFSGD